MRFKIKNLLIIILICSFITTSKSANEDDIYKKVDLFGEVLDKINKDYVEEIDQSDAMDAVTIPRGAIQAINNRSLNFN